VTKILREATRPAPDIPAAAHATSGSAADQAYSAIVDLIRVRDLRPGERTSANLLSARLGLGRTPVKEAITRLQAEGVLSVVGRSGTTVNMIGPEQTRQLFALRRTLEAFAIDAAVRNVTPGDLKSLRASVAQMRSASVDAEDFLRASARFVRGNVEFHTKLVGVAGNPFLDRLYAQLQMQVQIVTYLFHRGADPAAAKARLQEHERIVQALAKRDAPALKRLLRDHASGTEAAILAASAPQRAPAPHPRNGNGVAPKAGGVRR
jgi:DNA-binding GntR family transcriptional regulator